MKKLQTELEHTLKKVITFRIGLDVYEYNNNKTLTNWRDFEAELDIDYPIKGTAISFNAEKFETWVSTSDNQKIIDSEKDISSHDISCELASEPFKYEQMTFVYLFTIIEEFGNNIVKVTNPDFYKKEIIESGKSWHSKINRFQKKKNTDFADILYSVFKISNVKINNNLIELFFNLKEKRNNIAHKLEYDNIRNFRNDVESFIILICYLYYIQDDTKSEFEYYPWFDYDKNF